MTLKMTLDVPRLLSRRILSAIRNFSLLSTSRLARRVPMAFSDGVPPDNTDGGCLPAAVAVFRQALVTFPPTKEFPGQLEKLRSMMSHLTAEDLGLDPIFSDISLWKSPRKPPCTYIEVFQNQDINMSIFVLGPGYKMPLHDHPDMHGLLKVVSGSVKIRSFTGPGAITLFDNNRPMENYAFKKIRTQAQRREQTIQLIKGGNSSLKSPLPLHVGSEPFALMGTVQWQILGQFKAAKTDGLSSVSDRKVIAEVIPTSVCGENTETCLLTPTTSNYHEIEALEGPAAFLDILSPPYDGAQDGSRRRCHYYKVLGEVAPNIVEMQEIDVPDHFYCDQAPYLGPLLS